MRLATAKVVERTLGALAAALAVLTGCGSSQTIGTTRLTSLPEVPDDVALAPVLPCTMAGIGATALSADAAVTITEVSSGSTGMALGMGMAPPPIDKPYCLVKVHVDPQVNVWVAMPTRSWN